MKPAVLRSNIFSYRTDGRIGRYVLKQAHIKEIHIQSLFKICKTDAFPTKGTRIHLGGRLKDPAGGGSRNFQLSIVHVGVDVGKQRSGKVALTGVRQHGYDDTPLGS